MQSNACCAIGNASNFLACSPRRLIVAFEPLFQTGTDRPVHYRNTTAAVSL